MSSSVGGFAAPSMITHYCLRTPLEVSLSSDGKEFRPLALFSPLLSLAVLSATFLAGDPKTKANEATESDDEELPDETTPLAQRNRVSRRKSDGDTDEECILPTKPLRTTMYGRHRRRTIDCDRHTSVSMRSMTHILAPMTLIPPDDCDLYSDEDET